jgi:hypothetical protein
VDKLKVDLKDDLDSEELKSIIENSERIYLETVTKKTSLLILE